MKTLIVDTDDVLDLFGVDDRDIYAKGTIEDAIYNGTLKPIEPEHKTGRWEYIDYGGFGNYHCTACRKICICNGNYNFCPNCGAYMRGKNDEDD